MFILGACLASCCLVKQRADQPSPFLVEKLFDHHPHDRVVVEDLNAQHHQRTIQVSLARNSVIYLGLTSTTLLNNRINYKLFYTVEYLIQPNSG